MPDKCLEDEESEIIKEDIRAEKDESVKEEA